MTEPDPAESPEPSGRVTVTGPGPLVVIGLLGLFVGWGSRWWALQTDSPAPSAGWLLVGVTWFITAVTAGIAYLTRRTVRAQPLALTPQQGLTRLVLGKTIARIAAFALGGYLGLAISRLGITSATAEDVIIRSLVAALGAALGVAAGLLLEHACRVPPGDAADLP